MRSHARVHLLLGYGIRHQLGCVKKHIFHNSPQALFPLFFFFVFFFFFFESRQAFSSPAQ
eukprot:COSAG04_NODE_2847_length_3491_cov_3.264741_6_plen_59_part_01